MTAIYFASPYSIVHYFLNSRLLDQWIRGDREHYRAMAACNRSAPLEQQCSAHGSCVAVADAALSMSAFTIFSPITPSNVSINDTGICICDPLYDRDYACARTFFYSYAVAERAFDIVRPPLGLLAPAPLYNCPLITFYYLFIKWFVSCLLARFPLLV